MDQDNDGIYNYLDNWLNYANESQLDVDGDGYGDGCDADINNDCLVNFEDISLFQMSFLNSGADRADFDGDGMVNFLDLAMLRDGFLQAPGPSGTTQSCDSR